MKKQTLLKGSVILLTSAVVAKVLGAFFKIPLTNQLGGVGMGYFSCAYGLFLPIYALSVTGLSAAVAGTVAHHSALEDWRTVRRIRRIARLLFAGLGLLLTMVMLAGAKPFAELLAGEPDAWVCMAFMAPSAFFGCVTAVERGYYEGLQNMYPTGISQAVEAAAKLVFGLLCSQFVLEHPDWAAVYFPDGTDLRMMAAAAAVLGVTLSMVCGTFYMLLRNLWMGDSISRSMLAQAPPPQEGRSILRMLFHIMLPVALGSLVTNLTTLIDLMIMMRSLSAVQQRHGAALMQLYGALAMDPDFPAFVYGSFTGMAITVFNLIPSVTNMVGKSALTGAAQAHAVHNQSQLTKQAQTILQATAALAFPAACGLWALADPVLSFLYAGHEQETALAAQALRALMPGMAGLCLTVPLFGMLQGMGRADLPVKWMLVGVACKLAGNLLLIPIPQTSVSGAGIATSICYVVLVVCAVFAVQREIGCRLHAVRLLLPIGYAAVLCGGSAHLCFHLLASYGQTTALLLSVAAGGGVYFAALLLLGKRTILQVLGIKRSKMGHKSNWRHSEKLP